MPIQTHTVRDVMQKRFPGFPISEPFGSLCGLLWPGFQVLIWGPKGEGKSTFAMLFLAALSPYAAAMGKNLWYVSGEEGIGAGLQQRAERTGLSQDAFGDILLSGYEPMEWTDFAEEVTERNAAFVVLDSVDTLGWSGNDIYLFLDWAREHNVGIIFIAHALKDGKDYKGESALAHWVDCVIHIYREDGVYYGETEKSRALDQLPPRLVLPPDVSGFGVGPGVEIVEKYARENPNIGYTGDRARQNKIKSRCAAVFAELREEGKLPCVSGTPVTEQYEPPASEPVEDEPEPEEDSESAEEQAEARARAEVEEKSTADLLDELTALLN